MSKLGNQTQGKMFQYQYKDLKSGFLRLCVSGVLSVAYQTDEPVLRKFYFCPVKPSFMQIHPGQT